MCDVVSTSRNGSHFSREKQQKLDVQDVKDNKQNEGRRRRRKKKKKKKKRRSMFRSGSFNNDLDDILQRFVMNDTTQGRKKLDVFRYSRMEDDDGGNLPENHGNSIRSVR